MSDVSNDTAIATGTGTARTLASRFSDRYDVRDFASVQSTPLGSGGDDLPALQAAINAAAGVASLLIPAGLTLNISGPLQLATGTNLVLNGAIKLLPNKGTPNDVIHIASNINNISVTGTGIIDGNKSEQSSTTFSVGINSFNSSTCTNSNFYISGITIQNCLNMPVNINANNAIVENCTFLNNGNSPEFAGECENVHFFQCTSSGNNDGGFSFYLGASNGSMIACKSINNLGGMTVDVDAPSAKSSSNITISDNIFINNGSVNGPWVASNAAGNQHTNITVTNNLCICNTLGTTIDVSFIAITNVSNCICSGNIFQGQVGPNPSFPIVLSGLLNNIIVSDNYFTGNVGSGPILLVQEPASGSSGVVIKGNVFNSLVSGGPAVTIEGTGLGIVNLLNDNVYLPTTFYPNGPVNENSGPIVGNVTPSVAFAFLPVSPPKGTRCMINNAAAGLAWNGIAAGGGSTLAPVTWDGTNWRYL